MNEPNVHGAPGQQRLAAAPGPRTVFAQGLARRRAGFVFLSPHYEKRKANEIRVPHPR